MIDTNAHFTLRVKVKLELKSSIPIDAITEISSKCLTLGVKARLKKKIIFLIYHFMALTDLAPRQGKDTYQLGRSIMFNVMKYCCIDEIHTIGLKSNPICFLSSSFFFPLLLSFCACFIFFSSFVELFCLFVNDGGFLFFFYLGYGHEKHKNVYVIHGGLTFLGFSLRNWKHTQRLKPWSLLFELNGFFLHTNSLTTKQIIFYS
jgi:hypothetical protein